LHQPRHTLHIIQFFDSPLDGLEAHAARYDSKFTNTHTILHLNNALVSREFANRPACGITHPPDPSPGTSNATPNRPRNNKPDRQNPL